MFSQGHLIFLGLSVVLILFGVYMCRTRKPPLDKLIRICFLISLVLEAAKVFTVIQIVPVVEPAIENGALIYKETGQYAPYIQAEHLPFELCSLQIVFMFLSLVIKDRTWKKRIWALIYGTSIIGGTIALLLPSIAPEFATTAAFLGAPRAWEFFLYHSMIVVVGIAVGMDRTCGLRYSDMKWMMILVTLLDFSTFYLNSIMTVPYYRGDNLMGIGYAINYFSSYNNPLGIVVSTKAQYFVYLAIRILIALVLIPIVFLPFLRRKQKPAETEGKA